MLLDRLKEMLGKLRLPADTRAALTGARSPQELARSLDVCITANEVEFRSLQKEIEALEEDERGEIEKLKTRELGRRSKNASLMRVRRLRLQQQGLESRMRIHDDNMNLHIALLGKIQSLDAMEMQGLGESEIDSISLEFEEEVQAYASTLEAGADAISTALPDQKQKDAELSRLEAEIFGVPAKSDDDVVHPAEQRTADRERNTGPRSREAEPGSNPDDGRANSGVDRANSDDGRANSGDDRGKEAAWD